MTQEEACCVYCGSTEELKADPNLEDIWVCGPCLAKRDDHQSVIDFGFDDEEPAIE
jgi:hypothetical protein